MYYHFKHFFRFCFFSTIWSQIITPLILLIPIRLACQPDRIRSGSAQCHTRVKEPLLLPEGRNCGEVLSDQPVSVRIPQLLHKVEHRVDTKHRLQPFCVATPHHQLIVSPVGKSLIGLVGEIADNLSEVERRHSKIVVVVTVDLGCFRYNFATIPHRLEYIIKAFLLRISLDILMHVYIRHISILDNRRNLRHTAEMHQVAGAVDCRTEH